MPNREEAYFFAAIAVSLAIFIAYIFFNFFHLRNYRSSSRSTADKIALLLGLIGAIFLFFGMQTIVGEILWAFSSRVKINEEKVYGGILVAAPAAVVLSILASIVRLFGESSDVKKEVDAYRPQREKPSVEDQLKRSDVVVFSIIVTVIVLFAVVPNLGQNTGSPKSPVAEQQVSAPATVNRIVETFVPYKTDEKVIKNNADGSRSFLIDTCITCANGDCKGAVSTIRELRVSGSKILILGNKTDGSNFIIEYPSSNNMKCTVVPDRNYEFYCRSSETSNTQIGVSTSSEEVTFDGVDKFIMKNELFANSYVNNSIKSENFQNETRCLLKKDR